MMFLGYDKKEKLHIVVALAVIRNPGGKYLVLKRSEREITAPGLYTLPGGKSENNDCMEDTLQKEALEEANLELLPEKAFLGDNSFIRPDGQTVKSFAYLCKARDWKKARAGEDFTDLKWVAPSELKTLPHVEVIGRFIGRAGKLAGKGLGPACLNARSVK